MPLGLPALPRVGHNIDWCIMVNDHKVVTGYDCVDCAWNSHVSFVGKINTSIERNTSFSANTSISHVYKIVNITYQSKNYII
jgi:hypothetical protein